VPRDRRVPGVLQDLRFGFRLLARSPRYSAVAALTLAVGIGATTSIFTVVDGVLLRALPYRDPDCLVILRADASAAKRAPLSRPEIEDLQQLKLFDDVGSMNPVEGSLTGDEGMESVSSASATLNFLQVLGVTPLLGRHFSPAEDTGRQFVAGVIISYELWQRHYGGDPDIIGRRIETNNIPVSVVGVLPRGFRLYLDPGLSVPSRIDLWFPIPRSGSRTSRYQVTVARLKPGMTRERAQAELDALAVRLAATYPAAYPGGQLSLHITGFRDDVVASVRPVLLSLLVGVAMLLLISCANVAHLTLARGSVRTRELAIRQALGAGPRRLIQHMLVESLLLGVAGGVGGLLLTLWGVDALRAVAGTYLPRLEQIVINTTALLFNGAASVVAVTVFGLAPALVASRSDVCHGLRVGAGTGGRAQGGSRLRTALITTEVALTLVLLVAGALVLQTVHRLQRVDLGYRPHHVVVARTEVAPQLFRDPLRREAFYRDAVAAVRALPEVEAVALGRPLPLEGIHDEQLYAIDDRSSTEERRAARTIVSPGYFSTMGIRLLAGRDFSEADAATHRPVVILDISLARELWRDETAVGRRLMLNPRGTTPGWVDVIGIVDHTRADTLRAAGRPQIYVPYHLSSPSSASLVIRSRATAAALAPMLKDTIERLGGHRPVHAVLALESYVAEDMADGRFALFVFGALGAVGLTIASAGLYSVVSYTTARRTHEIGVRIALGARPLAIFRLVVGDSVRSTAAGVIIGLGLAAVLTHSIQSLLFEVSPLDALTFIGVAVLLVVVALAASYSPARRAVVVDPVIALQSD